MKCKYSLSSTILAPSREIEGWNAPRRVSKSRKNYIEQINRIKGFSIILVQRAAASGDCRRLCCSEAYPQGQAADQETEKGLRARTQVVFK